MFIKWLLVGLGYQSQVWFGRRPILATSDFVLFLNECFADPIMVVWESGSGIGLLSYLGSTFFLDNECIDGCINRRMGKGILIRDKEFNDKLGLWSLLLKIGLELGFEEMVGERKFLY